MDWFKGNPTGTIDVPMKHGKSPVIFPLNLNGFQSLPLLDQRTSPRFFNPYMLVNIPIHLLVICMYGMCAYIYSYIYILHMYCIYIKNSE